MLNSTNIKERENSEDYWKVQIDAFKKSGLSGQACCRKHDLNYNQFSYRIQKSKLQKKCVPPTLIPVSVKTPKVAKEVLCHVELKSGHSISVYEIGVLDIVLGGLF